MFDQDYFDSLLSGTTSVTSTENDNNEETTYNPQNYTTEQTTSPYVNYDYSSTPNYTEQQTYSPFTSNVMTDETEQKSITRMDVPMIEKTEAPVKLTKSRARIVLATRMKVVLSVFAIIVACLTFISIYNFAQVGKIESTFSSKQAEINSLQQSISELSETYTLISDDEYVMNWAETNGFVPTTEENTITVKLGEMHQEPKSEPISSNWFNDVCDFFSRLFA